MAKIKLGSYEAAILADMWRRTLRYFQRNQGLGRDNAVYRGTCHQAKTLVDKFEMIFELPEDGVVKTFKGFRDDLSLLEHLDGKSKKAERWLQEDIPVEVAIRIFELHMMDMMDTGYYDGFSDDDRAECLRIFGGTFANERGEMLSEAFEIIKKEIRTQQSEKQEDK